MRNKTPSARAKRVWQRLTEWYGERFTQQFGNVPTESWCEVIDRSNDSSIALTLASLKTTHLQHPPTFPEFESAVNKARGPSAGVERPDIQDQLSKYILRQHDRGVTRLTPRQIHGPWSWIIRWHPGTNSRGEHIEKWAPEWLGVIIPADGDHPSHRIMVEDMAWEHAA